MTVNGGGQNGTTKRKDNSWLTDTKWKRKHIRKRSDRREGIKDVNLAILDLARNFWQIIDT